MAGVLQERAGGDPEMPQGTGIASPLLSAKKFADFGASLSKRFGLVEHDASGVANRLRQIYVKATVYGERSDVVGDESVIIAFSDFCISHLRERYLSAFINLQSLRKDYIVFARTTASNDPAGTEKGIAALDARAAALRKDIGALSEVLSSRQGILAAAPMLTEKDLEGDIVDKQGSCANILNYHASLVLDRTRERLTDYIWLAQHGGHASLIEATGREDRLLKTLEDLMSGELTQQKFTLLQIKRGRDSDFSWAERTSLKLSAELARLAKEMQSLARQNRASMSAIFGDALDPLSEQGSVLRLKPDTGHLYFREIVQYIEKIVSDPAIVDRKADTGNAYA